MSSTSLPPPEAMVVDDINHDMEHRKDMNNDEGIKEDLQKNNPEENKEVADEEKEGKDEEDDEEDEEEEKGEEDKEVQDKSDSDEEGASSDGITAPFDANGGVAKEGKHFCSATPIVPALHGLLVPLFLCLVGKDMCPTFQSKQKLKRHLLVKHNFGTVEEGLVGRPPSNPGRPPWTTLEQNKRYNDAARSNPISREAIRIAKTRRRFEISAAAAWERKKEELKEFKIPKVPPPLARLFNQKTFDYFGIRSWDSAPISRGVFGRFRTNREAHDIIAGSNEKYMTPLKGAWDLGGEWKKPSILRKRNVAYLALSKYAMARWKHAEWATKSNKADYVREKVAAQMAANSL